MSDCELTVDEQLAQARRKIKRLERELDSTRRELRGVKKDLSAQKGLTTKVTNRAESAEQTLQTCQSEHAEEKKLLHEALSQAGVPSPTSNPQSELEAVLINGERAQEST